MTSPTIEIGCANYKDLRFTERVDIQPSPATTTVADMRDLSVFPDNTFAFAKCAASIEHITHDDQHKAVKEFHRILVPHGLIWVQTPDKSYWTERLNSKDDNERAAAEIQMTGGMRDEFDYHKGLLTRDEISTLFIQNGFAIVWLRDGNEASGSLDLVAEAVK